MRIRSFGQIVHQCAQHDQLKDCNLVIDAQNFFYKSYVDGNVNDELGAECDQYDEYLRRYLRMFKEANVNCYFIFKGGYKYFENNSVESDRQIFTHVELDGQTNDNSENSPPLQCIFKNEVEVQVLEDMKFNYVFTEYEAKSDCIALAKKLSCPVLSMDIEFALAGVTYIPKVTIKFDNYRKIINCKTFMLDRFLSKFKLNKEKLAMFILLTDETIVPKGTFTNFFKIRRIPEYLYTQRNMSLLYFLSKSSEETVMQEILKHVETPTRIIENLDKARKFVTQKVVGDMAIDYFFSKEVTERWFESGVALNIIAKSYVDLYRSDIPVVPGLQLEGNIEHPKQMSLNIIKYAYDLLTNFQNKGLKFLDQNSPWISGSIAKPTYQATQCVFENGWDNICSLGLFQHFLTEELNFDFAKLEKAPAEAQLLLIALVYLNHKKTENANRRAYGIILCYVMLSVVDKAVDKSINGNILRAIDCKLAEELLHECFIYEHEKTLIAFDSELYFSIVEFRHCLKEFNFLNKLCGSPFKPTIYSKSVNGTFWYKFGNCVPTENERMFLNKILGPAPTVLHYVNHIIDIYQDLLP